MAPSRRQSFQSAWSPAGIPWGPRWEEPQRVVRPVGGMARFPDIGRVLRGILMTGAVGELHQGQSAAVVDLGGEHEAQLLRRPLRLQVDDPLDVLHRVPVTVAVAQAAVEEGCGPGPGEGDKAVVGIPGVDHSIELGAGGLDPETGQLPVPIGAQRLQLPLTHPGCLPIALQQGGALPAGLFPQQEGDCDCLPRLQCHGGGQGPAAVAVVVEGPAQVAPLHTYGVSVAPVGAEKFRPVSAVRGNRRPGQAEEPLNHILLVHVALLGVQIAVDLLADTVLAEQRPGDKLGVLQIDLVLLIVAVVGKFGVARQGQLPAPVRSVDHGQPPHLVRGALRDVKHRLAVDTAVVSQHFGIPRPVAALALVCIQILPHRLPGGGPEVP